MAHVRCIDAPMAQIKGIDMVRELWDRSRFMASALGFVVIVSAPDGVYFTTIKDFDKDAIHVKARAAGFDSREKFVIPRSAFKELKPEGAQIGPGSRAA